MKSAFSNVLLVLGLSACTGGATSRPDLGSTPDLATVTPPTTGPVAKGPSKSGTVAISDDDATVAVVNQDNGSVSFFNTATNTLLSTVATGGTPTSVVIASDRTTAYVANRADATVVKITGIRNPTPTVGTPVNVGSEPTGLALSPTGARLYVAEFGESTIGAIDTSTMVRTTFASNLRNARALTVTNNGDTNDSDELVVVPEYYGEPTANGEGKNDGRVGRVHLFKTSDGTDQGPMALNPFTNTDSSFDPKAAPNQLYSVAVANGRIFIPSVSASAEPPVGYNRNVYPVVYVGDLTTGKQVVGGSGTVNLSEAVNKLPVVPGSPRFFLAETVDIGFLPTTNVAFLVSRGADVIQRVDFSQSPPAIGSAQNNQIDVLGSGATSCQNPTGIAVAATLNRAYVNCWVTKRMAVINLSTQRVETVVDSVPAATPTAVDRGRRFFYTARGRWSGNGNATTQPTEGGSAWSSCGTCHPDGLSDNITWIFPAGPRQANALDGSFSHSPTAGTPKQRVFNWTATMDEVHDFENNVRNVSGGIGAITSGTTCSPAGPLANEVRSIVAATGLDVVATMINGMTMNLVNKEVQDLVANNCVTDFDDIGAYMQTLRPTRGRRFLDQASVTRGAALFSGAGGCANCHGGSGWTISNRFYTPAGADNNAPSGLTSLRGTAFVGALTAYSTTASANANQISLQAMSADPSVSVAIPPLEVTCALRDVGTFGVPGDANATNALEVRSAAFAVGAGTSTRAQGMGGFNVPSLYGMQLGAPYLHHGQAPTLTDLFTNTRWQTHWQAGNSTFLTGGTAAQDRMDIINFILSIDNTTAEQAVPTGYAGGCSCPLGAGSC